MSGDNGRAAVVGEAVSEAARALDAGAGEQMAMFEPPTKFLGDEAEQVRTKIQRAAGRPPGAQNRATKAIREYLLGRGVNPLEQLARWGMHTPETLARELGCTPLEAYRELRATWSELAPYLYGRAAPTDDQGNAVPMLAMFLGGAPTAGPGARAPWQYLDEENQALSGPAGQVSHGAVSHEDAK